MSTKHKRQYPEIQWKFGPIVVIRFASISTASNIMERLAESIQPWSFFSMPCAANTSHLFSIYQFPQALPAQSCMKLLILKGSLKKWLPPTSWQIAGVRGACISLMHNLWLHWMLTLQLFVMWEKERHRELTEKRQRPDSSPGYIFVSSPNLW